MLFACPPCVAQNYVWILVSVVTKYRPQVELVVTFLLVQRICVDQRAVTHWSLSCECCQSVDSAVTSDKRITFCVIPLACDKRSEGSLRAHKNESVEPRRGDVLITSEANRHFLSIVPGPHILCFKDILRATKFATSWADARGCEVWRRADGATARWSNRVNLRD